MFYSHMQTEFPFNSIARLASVCIGYLVRPFFTAASATKWPASLSHGTAHLHQHLHTYTHTLGPRNLTRIHRPSQPHFYSTNCWYARSRRRAEQQPSCLVSCSLCAWMWRCESDMLSVRACVCVCVGASMCLCWCCCCSYSLSSVYKFALPLWSVAQLLHTSRRVR